jgi:hypothetical protein
MNTRKVFFRFLVLFIALFSVENSLRGQTALTVSPSTQAVIVGASVTVQIRIANVANLHGYSISAGFDNSILQYQSIDATSGTLLGSFPNTYFVSTQPSGNPNTVQVDQAILGNTSTSGSGALFAITFTAISPGISPIAILSYDLRDGDNQHISATVSSGQVAVFGVSPPPTVLVNAKVFLQGPYFSGSMSTALNCPCLGYLPLAQPYSGTPWNYGGTEAVSSGFFANHSYIVDWILLELRGGSSPGGAPLGRRAAFIKNNGSIIDIDGSSPVTFAGLSVLANYYLVVRHRNHLSVMSASPIAVNFSTGRFEYDFTPGLSQYYGGDAASLWGGIYGMYAGDVNGNGMLKYNGANNDRSLIYIRIGGSSVNATVSGYFPEDVNMDGTVKYNGASNDRAIIFVNVGGSSVNATRAAQVP